MSTPRVLIADDSRVLRTVLRKQLSGEALEIDEAEDGASALERCRTNPPDVLLLDVAMPGMSGHDVLRAMQADPALAGIPVVFLSGRVDADDVAEGLRLGAHDYLRKPVETGELIARVSAAIRTKRLHDQLRQDNAQLRELAAVDPLTGLLDIRGLQQRLLQLSTACQEQGTALAGVLVDVVRLAAFNEHFGPNVGDDVLRRVAAAVSERVPPGAVVGRCGPDEFLALMADVGQAEAVGIARTIADTVAATPLSVGGRVVRVSVSVGASSALDADPKRLLKSLQDAVVADRAARPGPRPAPAEAPAPPAGPATASPTPAPEPVAATPPAADESPAAAEAPSAEPAPEPPATPPTGGPTDAQASAATPATPEVPLPVIDARDAAAELRRWNLSNS